MSEAQENKHAILIIVPSATLLSPAVAVCAGGILMAEASDEAATESKDVSTAPAGGENSEKENRELPRVPVAVAATVRSSCTAFIP